MSTLFNRFATLKEGDRVRIIKAPNCDNGWNNCKHFLIKGAAGTVHEVDYYDDHFYADVEFDKETWIDREGVKRDVKLKHTFRMCENQIERALDNE